MSELLRGSSTHFVLNYIHPLKDFFSFNKIFKVMRYNVVLNHLATRHVFKIFSLNHIHTKGTCISVYGNLACFYFLNEVSREILE